MEQDYRLAEGEYTDGIISALMNIMHKGAPPLRQGTVQ